MKKGKGITLLTTVLLAGCALLASSLSASASDINAAGVVFKAASGGSQSCLSRSSYGGLQNNCSYAVEVMAWMPLVNTGWHDTSVRVWGNNSWCQSVTTNGVGNGSHVGEPVWTFAGPDAWNTIDTGARYTWTDTPLVFRCLLDAGEKVATAQATW